MIDDDMIDGRLWSPWRRAEQQAQQDAARAAQMGGMGGGAGGGKANAADDFWYDVGGWVCFAGVALSWVVMLSRQNAAA